MTPSDITHVAVEGLYLALLLSGPALLTSLVVGFALGIFQTLVQVHEPSLTFVPKLIAVGLSLAVFGAWMGRELIRFTQTLWQVFP
ncbi:MAG: flagellar biosynthetic protein FliQ [Myxococcales bacterium]|nr:flagellar biosynthetic protein FliQ [Myxococcales bacterium]MCB9708923.1 flagellar biosynthetic protein FliQ [Myxococcales bacterium]